MGRSEEPEFKRQVPKWALVLWPNSTSPSCIPLADLYFAVNNMHAIPIAVEDAELTGYVTEFQPYIGRPRSERKQPNDKEDHS